MLARRLERGDTIGIAAPASIETLENIENGIARLKSLGFKIKKGKHILDKWGYFSGTDEDRAKDIMDMFEDREVKLILCIRGGYGSMRLLPFIDFNMVRKNPKLFVGYSDITVLMNSFYERAGLITFHGPMLSSNLYVMDTLESFLISVMEGYKEYSIANPVNVPMRSNTDKIAEGEIVGGNLSMICSTLGTPYEINTKNKLLLLEDIEEPPYKVDRMLTQLGLSGKLGSCAGIILGQFTNCEGEPKENYFTLEQVMENRILSFRKPTIMNVMCGHDNPKLTLPIGAKARLNCKAARIDILEAVCR